MVYRRAGDKYLLIEYGPLVLDLNLRFRVHALMTRLQADAVPGILDLTPGIRSLQVHYDSRVLPLTRLLDLLLAAEKALPAIEDMQVPTRIVHLPLSWDDAATRLAIEKYMQSVRKDAPWCPSNIEFIRRINGLESIEDVKRIVFDASYLVMGLGDVYLGAPVATPVDPRHRLVTTKYNPARTWTPENAVGIGGAYLCVYGMEGPGGYQFVGRTLQMWNRWRQTADFTDGKPWLLRFFDQIRFFPVSEAGTAENPRGLPARPLPAEDRGNHLQPARLQRLPCRQQRIHRCLQDAAAGRVRSRARALARERPGRIRQRPDRGRSRAPTANSTCRRTAAPSPATSPATCGRCEVEEGAAVKQGDPLVIVESMKMEFAVMAPCDGRIHKVFCREGGQVSAGQDLLVLVSE